MNLLKRSSFAVRLVSSSGSQASAKFVATSMPIKNMSALSANVIQYRSFTSSNIMGSEADFVCPTDINKPPAEKIDRLADEVLALNFLEMNQLMRYMQKRMNLPEEFYMSGGLRGGGGGGGGGGAGAAGGAAVAAEPVKVKDAFDLKLTEVDAKVKIKIIKEVRAITGLGLKEAKEMVEGAPIMVKQGLKKDEADKLLKLLIDAGAKAELL